MDKELRNSLRTVVAACRQVLEEDIGRQLEAPPFGVTPRGEFLAGEDLAAYSLDPRDAARERGEVIAAISHIESYGADRPRAVEQFVRESAFTVLNRLAALKLMENASRALIPESVGHGRESKGFLLFQKVSPEVCRAARNGAVVDGGYRLFLECIFDDLSEELGVLFDRRLPQSIIFPSDACLKRVLDLLNQADVVAIWGEDETIGWIYQYFTPKELRDEARKASQAPRNSYELAFRNQFFTPRYVVEFLVDNTLGRIWVEMRGGETRLRSTCKYLCLQPGNDLAEPGEATLSSDAAEQIRAENAKVVHQRMESLNKGLQSVKHPSSEPLPGPVGLPGRKKKDPRDLRILDPACGSGHFLLYAFDLLETIYVEAWDDAEGPPCEATGRRLRDDFPEREDFRRAIPEMIVGHNLYGVDIDLRATQIAALAIWLRAQRSYQEQSFKLSGRPLITRSNIVCAEPMPGERELLEEFVATIQPKLLGQLVRVVFDKMALADEAGLLLPIEEEIRGAVAEAKRQWQAGPKPEQLMLFPAEKRTEQLALFDVRGITDESFWLEAEGRVVESLREYARRAANGRSYSRRLFAEDATQGFAFIDIARKRFDAVVMNPPFGLSPPKLYDYLNQRYPLAFIDLLAAFVERASALCDGGYIGALTSRACLYTATLQEWREQHLVGRILALADLGIGVLDGAMVRACAYVIPCGVASTTGCFINARRAEEKAEVLQAAVGALVSGRSHKDVHVRTPEMLAAIPQHRILYSLPPSFWQSLRGHVRFEPAAGTARAGLTTYDDDRFLRLLWEVRPERAGSQQKWIPISKGGYFGTFYADIHLCLNWEDDGREVGEHNKAKYGTDAQSRRGSRYYNRPALTYARRTDYFSARLLPTNCFFSDKGPAILPEAGGSVAYLLAVFNSDLFRGLVHCQSQGGCFETGVIKVFPWVSPPDQSRRLLENKANDAWRAKARIFQLLEDNAWGNPAMLVAERSSLSGAVAWIRQQLEETTLLVNANAKAISEAVDSLYSVSGIDYEDMEVFEDDHRIQEIDEFTTPQSVAHAVLSFALGCVYGRWDARLALDPSLSQFPPEPGDLLPACAPGRLVNPDGLPATSGKIVSQEWLRRRRDARSASELGDILQAVTTDGDYPVRVDWDGILADDAGHIDDVVQRVREVLDVLFGERAGAVEAESCQALGIADIREYFRNSRGFFEEHVKRYSKSRRKAPIYWLLQSPRKSYGLWIYYPRLDRDTVFKALRNYVEPKIKGEATRLKELKGRLEEGRETLARRERSKLEKDIERQDALLGELGTFKESIERVSALGYEPDLDDGVVLNMAPFHELTPWKEAKAYWKELLDGGYAWSTIAKRLRAREAAATPPGRSERHG